MFRELKSDQNCVRDSNSPHRKLERTAKTDRNCLTWDVVGWHNFTKVQFGTQKTAANINTGTGERSTTRDSWEFEKQTRSENIQRKQTQLKLPSGCCILRNSTRNRGWLSLQLWRIPHPSPHTHTHTGLLYKYRRVRTLYFPTRFRVWITLCWVRCISARRSRPSRSAVANLSCSSAIVSSPTPRQRSRSVSMPVSSSCHRAPITRSTSPHALFQLESTYRYLYYSLRQINFLIAII